MHFFFRCKLIEIASKISAIDHNGTAILVRNSKGIALSEIPMSPSSASIPKQTLWHTCQDPSILAIPEILPVDPTTFSFMCFIIMMAE